MKKMMLAAFLAVLILCGAAFAAGQSSEGQSSGAGHPSDTGQLNGAGASGQNAWIEQFNDVCSATTASMALSKGQLKSRISRTDALKLRLDGLEESAKKVYSRRLRMCHDMYDFSLKAKEKADTKK